MNKRPIGKNDLQSEHVSGRKSVLQTVRSPGVLGNIPADAADRLRGRVRGIKVSLWLDPAGNVQIDHPGFHNHPRILKVNFENAIHPRQANDNAVENRQRSAAQARSRTAGDKGNALSMTDADNRLQLGSIGGQQDREGHDAKIRQPVAFVGVQLFRRTDEAGRTNDRSKLFEDGGFHGRLSEKERLQPSARGTSRAECTISARRSNREG